MVGRVRVSLQGNEEQGLTVPLFVLQYLDTFLLSQLRQKNNIARLLSISSTHTHTHTHKHTHTQKHKHTHTHTHMKYYFHLPWGQGQTDFIHVLWYNKSAYGQCTLEVGKCLKRQPVCTKFSRFDSYLPTYTTNLNYFKITLIVIVTVVVVIDGGYDDGAVAV